MKTKLSAIFMTLTLSLGAHSSSYAQATTWNAYTFGPSEALANVQGLKRIINAIEQDTNG